MQKKGTDRAAGTASRASLESLESRVFLSVAAPTGLDATLVAPRAVVLEWGDVTGETGYVVERRVDGTTEPWARIGDTAADVTRFTQDGLAPGKTYLYRVRAREGDLASEPSNVDFVTVPAEPTVPATPRLEGNFLLLEGANGAALRWTNVANETGYRLERWVDGMGDSTRAFFSVDADTTEYNDAPLDAGKTYLYRVRAVNAQGQPAASNTVAIVVPGTGVPAAPRELVAELVQGRFVRLRWVDVAGEKGYKIERRIDGSGSGEWVQVGTTAENVITFADESVERGKTYVYRVRAFNDAGNSPYSNTAAVSVPTETPTPPAPTELNAELTDARRVRLTWNNVAGEKGYKVERRLDGTDAWAQIGTTAADVTTFVDENVAAGKTYIYRVRAFNDAGNSSYSNTDAVRIPGEVETPVAPRLEVQLVAPRAAKLTWTNVANETGYKVERRVDGTDAWVQIRSVGADVTTITDDGLEPGKTYIYRVRAFNAAGNSPYSNTGIVRVLQDGLPTAPRELRAVVTSPTRVELHWVDSSGETGYRIERRIDGTDLWVKVGGAAANATSFADTTVVAGKTYIYRVRAFNDVGNSPWSNTAAAKVGDEGPTAPVAPRLEGALVAPRAARLAWTNVANETGYRVERRVDGSTEEWRVIRTVGADVTSITEDGLEVGKTYLYRVVAFNAVGASPASNIVALKPTGETPTRLAAPRDLKAAAVSPTQINLTWIGVEGETGYRLERRLDGTDLWEKVTFAAADVTSFSDRTVQPGKTYIYRVRAQSATESSAWSNTAAAKTPESPVVGTTGVFSATRIAPLDL